MPLNNGIADFDMDNPSVYADEIALARVFEKRAEILTFFRDNNELLTRPYLVDQIHVERKIIIQPANADKGIREVSRREVVACDFVAQSCCDNPIYAMLCNVGAGPEYIDALSSFRRWEFVEFATDLESSDEAQGYALIDLSLYAVFLLNIYQPSQPLIANLFATNVQIDALGRENVQPAIRAIAKVVSKALGRTNSYFPAERYATDLLLLVRADSAGKSRRTMSNGIAFERECESILREAGFEVRTTPGSGDYGADLIAFKDDLGYAIQCKDTVKPVGIKAVQEAVGARSHYRTDYAVVCCSGGFTDAAVELATSNKVLLCNGEQLARRLDSV